MAIRKPMQREQQLSCFGAIYGGWPEYREEKERLLLVLMMLCFVLFLGLGSFPMLD